MPALTSSDREARDWRYFDAVAQAYDAVRPGYPDALFEEIFRYAGPVAVHRALEIGCGTGQATWPMARRGLPLVCIEPGPHLATLARQNLAGFQNVQVLCSSFEEWVLEAEPFDLVFSANAIHWVHSRERTRKTARALRAGGVLALFRSVPLRDSAIEREIDALMGYAARRAQPSQVPKESQFRKSGYFDDFTNYRYEACLTFDAESYCHLLSTINRYQRIPPDVRSKRIAQVRDTLLKRGGSIQTKYATHLLLARKRNPSSWWNRLFPRCR